MLSVRKRRFFVAMQHAIAYYRVSTARQGAPGLASRPSGLQSAALPRATRLVAEFTEIETGKGADALDRRPQLAAALAAGKTGKCPVIVAKLDRLSRDVAFIAGLMAQHVPFIVAELGADADPFMLHLYAALAEKRASADLRADTVGPSCAKASSTMFGNRSNPAEAAALGPKAQSQEAAAFTAHVLPIVASLQTSGVRDLRSLAAALNSIPC
jgi:hypothetical protein